MMMALYSGEQRIALGFGEEDAIGHQLDVGIRAGTVIEADLATDFAAPIGGEFLGDAAGDGERGDTAGLGATDLGGNAEAGFEAHLGNLCGLAGTGLAGDDDDLMRADGGDDLVLARSDREFRRIMDGGQAKTAFLAQGDRGADSCSQQTIEDGAVGIGMKAVAERARTMRPPSRTQSGSMAWGSNWRISSTRGSFMTERRKIAGRFTICDFGFAILRREIPGAFLPLKI